MKKGVLLLVVVVFGLPFLLLTDVFPFHRFGMFAGLASKTGTKTKTEIEIYSFNRWKKLETGNEYLDNGYLPKAVDGAFGKPQLEKELGLKLFRALKSEPDSIKICRRTRNLPPDTKAIYP